MKKFIAALSLSAVSLALHAQDTIVLRLNQETGIDASVYSCIPCDYDNNNYGNDDEILAAAWTNNSNISNVRGLFRFYFPGSLTIAGVQHAGLYLYHNPGGNNIGHSTLSGPNDCYIERIVTPWQENTVTWNNQPQTTIQNSIIMPASTSNLQDYLNLDVTALVQDMVADPGNSYGFMIRLASEQFYRSMKFASSDYTNPLLYPMLVITTVNSLPTGLEETSKEELISFPNPASGMVTMRFSHHSTSRTITVTDMTGKVVLASACDMVQQDLDVSGLAEGVYAVTVVSGNEKKVSKLVIAR